jgi:hypothetical protein
MTELRMNITTKVIKKYGWEYHLVEVTRPEGWHVPQPCFMGFKNMALVSCNRVIPTNKNKKL